MADEAHAFLAPSGAHIWGPGGCPYYPTIAARYPGDEGEAAREGTAAHHLVAARLVGDHWEVGGLAPNGVVITDEMVECTDVAIAYVHRLRLDGVVEQRLEMPQVHPTQCWGTGDWFAMDETSNTVYVMDYKHGHRYVGAWENPQLILYGLGVLNHFGVVPDESWNFVFAIVQPRAFHPDGSVKVWKCSGKRFMDLVGEIAEAAALATGKLPFMRTGDHCNDCEGRVHCPAFQQTAGASLDVSRMATPHEMDPAALGTMRAYALAAIKRLEGMVTGIDAQVERVVRGGAVVPGATIEPTRTRLAWNKPMDEVFALGDIFGVPTRKPTAITPQQAIDNGIDEAVILEYAERPPGKLKVVSTDKHAAAKAFK